MRTLFVSWRDLLVPLVVTLASLGPARAAEPSAQGYSPPQGANAIDSIDVDLDDGAAHIAIRGARKPEFSLFRLTSPTRIVIDMPDADVAATRAPSRFADGALVTAVTTTQFRGRSGPVGRVVVVLRGEVEIEAKASGNAVLLEAKARPPAAPPYPVLPAAGGSEGGAPVIEITGDPDVPAAKASRILGVEGREHGEGSLVLIRTDGEIARYQVEEAADPARLVVDVYGVTVPKGLDKSFDATAMSRARTWQHPDHVRIVLDARVRQGTALPRYDVATTGEGLAILFLNDEAIAPKSAAVHMRALTFDKKNGFWRLRAELGGPVVVRTVKNAPDEKVIALDGVSIADRLLGSRGLAGGSVRDIVLSRDDTRSDSVRIRLALHSEVEHSVWQRDGAVYWDVRPVFVGGAQVAANAGSSEERVQPAAAPFSTAALTMAHEGMSAQQFRGRKLTIDLQDAEIVNVVRLIGDVSGKNVVVAEDVKGKVTLKLKNVPWDQALDVILKTKDLGQETRGGIIRVVLQSKLDAERETRLKLQEDREKKLPTTVRLIPVNYAVAKEMEKQVQSLLSLRGKVSIDDRTNVIIVEDIRDNLDQAERLVRTLDTQTPQVLIEARMVEGSTQFSRTLGIQWGGGLFFSQRGGNPTGLVFPNNAGVVGAADNAASASSPGVFFPSNFAVNLPASNTNTGIGLNLGSVGNYGFLNARLSAAEASGQARVVSAPRVTTLNNKRARITQGTQISVPIATANTVSVQTVNAALELEVTPHVTADGSILMAINLSNNTPDFGQQVPGAPPPVQTKEAETEMLVKDGDTAVIGGIYTRTQGETYQQTPLLGSIPILGWLFKNVSETDNRTEMLVFITPRIVNRRSAIPTTGGL